MWRFNVSYIGHSNSLSPFRLKQPESNGSVIPDSIGVANAVTGTVYRITSVGDTDFTLMGSANSNLHTTFTATGTGSGTGEIFASTTHDFIDPTNEFSQAGVNSLPWKVVGELNPVWTTSGNDGRNLYSIQHKMENGLNRVNYNTHSLNTDWSWFDSQRSIKINLQNSATGDLVCTKAIEGNDGGNLPFLHQNSSLIIIFGI